MVGPVDWKTEDMGFCTCPGEHLHTKQTAPNHCAVYLSGTPNVACFHHSCEDERQAKSEELRRKLGPRIQTSWRSSWGKARAPKDKPTFDPAKLQQVAGQIPENITPGWLADRSPVPVENMTPHDFLTRIYQPGERVLIFVGRNETQGTALWPGERFRTSHENGVWFQAQPVDGLWRAKRIGTGQSRRTAECVTSFRFMVVESDVAQPDLWLKALVQMRLPITAIYHSGGKSIHALVRLDARSREQWEAKAAPLKPGLITLGADPASLTSVRLTRLPNAHRGTRKQELFYLNPEPISEPLYAHAQ
ncbi:MAG: hypothetical protein QOE70_6370 [Chthoniobacter sp.]|nr:hypothetical protein [Chthoniobacter sp.]